MEELLQAAFSPVNAVFSILFLLTILYWLMVIIGALDLSFLDFDIDLGTDIDGDLEADYDADIGMEGGFFRAILGFFYIGEVPVMILISILVWSLWFLTMIGNLKYNPDGSFLIALPIFGVNFLISVFICKIVGKPMAKIFNAFEKDANAPRKVMGRICSVVSTEITNNLGQAEVKTKGAPLLLNVMAQEGSSFKKGDEAVVIGKDEEKGVYIIAPVELEK